MTRVGGRGRTRGETDPTGSHSEEKQFQKRGNFVQLCGSGVTRSLGLELEALMLATILGNYSDQFKEFT